jgi:crotonobetainyl-CoA:carnitine CoA-transferase CaiB-like acyl-CoA transferase
VTATLLDGVVVLDFSRYASGPSATQLLADHGARVIKVEAMSGDPFRSEGPGAEPGASGGYFMRFNRSKEGIACDLDSPDGIEVVRDLVRRADVVVENFRAGFLAERGLDYAALSELNPGIILASISGFGGPDVLPSPDSGRPAFAVIAEAEGGVINRIGDVTCGPHWSGVSLGDLYAGTYTAAAVAMALVRRARDGRGDHIDLAMTDVMIALDERAILMTSLTGTEPERGQASSMVGPVTCADGSVVAGVVGPRRWRILCDLVGGPDLVAELEAWTDDWMLFKNGVALPRIAAWASDRSAAEVRDAFESAGVPAGVVKTAAQVIGSEHARARRMLLELDYPGVGSGLVSASPVVTRNSQRVTPRTPPLLGEHTAAVLTELLGYSDERTSRLAADGAVRLGP